MKSKLSPSIMCADPLHMKKDLDILAREGVDYFHCDIMDGHFVPNLMLSTETMKAVKQAYQVPLDIHIMSDQPERVMQWLPFGKGDLVSIHYESTPHVDWVLRQIAERGATPALAIRPDTALNVLLPFLPSIGMLLLLTVQPGFAGQKMVPGSLERIRQARQMMNEAGRPDIMLEADGNCSLENIPKMEAAGADIFVVGTSSAFSKANGLEKGLSMTRACLKK